MSDALIGQAKTADLVAGSMVLKSERMVIREWRDQSIRMSAELRDSVRREDPEWCRARRMEYLESRRDEATKELASFRLWWGKLLKKSRRKSDREFSMAYHGGIERDLVRAMEKAVNAVKFYSVAVPKGMVSQEEIERAKTFPLALLLSESVGERMPCIFHGGKNDNLVLGDKGKGHCFVCNKSYDSIDWVMKERGVSFLEAVREICRL